MRLVLLGMTAVVLAAAAWTSTPGSRGHRAVVAHADGAPSSPRAGETTTTSDRAIATAEVRLEELVQRLEDGEFDWAGDVATGRFLDAFHARADQLNSVDLDEMKVLHRGRGWVVVEAPYRPLAVSAGTARIRFVERGGRWKVEQLVVMTISLARRERGSPPQSSHDVHEIFSDVTQLFEAGEDSGLLSLTTWRERRAFETWREVALSGTGRVLPRLSFLGLEPGGVKKYALSFAGGERLGVIKLQRIDRWHLVGIAAAGSS